jgi:hypothetical protein
MLNFTGYNCFTFKSATAERRDPVVGFRSTRRKIISCAEAFNRFAIDFLKVLEHFSHFVQNCGLKEGFRNLPPSLCHFLNDLGLMAVVDALSRYIFSLLQSYEISIMYSPISIVNF